MLHTPLAPAHRDDTADAVVVELSDAIAGAHHLDTARLRRRPDAPLRADTLELLGPSPIRTAADALDRVDVLARALVDRMRTAGWDEGEAPRATTSVLAASVPAAEATLLRAARSRGR